MRMYQLRIYRFQAAYILPVSWLRLSFINLKERKYLSQNNILSLSWSSFRCRCSEVLQLHSTLLYSTLRYYSIFFLQRNIGWLKLGLGSWWQHLLSILNIREATFFEEYNKFVKKGVLGDPKTLFPFKGKPTWVGLNISL